MKMYKNYHTTGGRHMIEFAKSSTGAWHYRLSWAPTEFKPLTSMEGAFDGDGLFWGIFNGRKLIRLDEVDKTTQWEGARYPKEEAKAIAPPPPPPAPEPAPVPPVPVSLPSTGTLTLEDLSKGTD